MNEPQYLINTVCIYFDGVIKQKGSDKAIAHAIPHLYKEIEMSEKVFIWDPNYTPNEIKDWISHHDMEWRECCNRILADPKEDDDDKETAKYTLSHGALVPRLHFPKTKPKCDEEWGTYA